MGYGAVVPIGPSELEVDRLRDLTESLCAYEPDIDAFVLIDDSPRDRHLTSEITLPAGCELISLVNPRQSLGHPLMGGQCASMLSALRAINSCGPLDFVIKLDTDALVISSFRDRIKTFLSQHPDAGLVGVAGPTCRRDAPLREIQARTTPRLVKGVMHITEEILSQVKSQAGITCDDNTIYIPEIGRLNRETLIGFAEIRPHICRAMENGYSTLEYCQGGAYALTSETLTRMEQTGYLNNLLNWLWIPVAEDVMMGMYTRAVGLKILDFSDNGEPFGIQYQGLAYSPSELLRRGHALIHSVKNDPSYTELEIRKYFRRIRRMKARLQ